MKLLPCVIFVLTWGTTAWATPDFPGVVEQVLGLKTVTIDPPQGCTLCHATDSGGTSLRPFGALVQRDGAQPYQESTLEQALGAIAQNEPELIADIKAGRDPNDDPGASSLPTPEYGCAISARAHDSLAWVVSLVALAVLGVRRVRPRTWRGGARRLLRRRERGLRGERRPSRLAP